MRLQNPVRRIAVCFASGDAPAAGIVRFDTRVLAGRWFASIGCVASARRETIASSSTSTFALDSTRQAVCFCPTCTAAGQVSRPLASVRPFLTPTHRFLALLVDSPTACRYDPIKMPECHFFADYGVCNNHECLFQHIDPESKIKDCAWYARGFCKHGEWC